MKVCFFTGSRADYGLLKPLIEKFQNRKQFKTDVIVSEVICLKDMDLLLKK